MDLLTKKKLKQMKRSASEESVLQIGYFEGIMQVIPSYALIEAVQEIAHLGWVTDTTHPAEIQNILVSEAIKKMNYQDFKQVAPYLFSYPHDQREVDRLVRPVEISRDYFEELQANANELFSIKEERKQKERVEGAIQELETDRTPNGDEVLGVDLLADMVLLLRSPENSQVEEWEVKREGLITDYRSPLSDYEQVIDSLFNLENSQITTILYEEVVHYHHRYWADSEPIQLTEETRGLLAQEGVLNSSDDHIRDFESLPQAYQYGGESEVFKETFPSYQDFVADYVLDKEKYELYSFRSEALSLAEELVSTRLEDINQTLNAEGQELMIERIVGYSQGEEWYLAYLRDVQEESQEEVKNYLEHEIGAWYRGSLTELALIRIDQLDPEKGFTGKQESVYHIDQDRLYRNRLERVQELLPETRNFVSPQVALEALLEKKMNTKQVDHLEPSKRL